MLSSFGIISEADTSATMITHMHALTLATHTYIMFFFVIFASYVAVSSCFLVYLFALFYYPDAQVQTHSPIVISPPCIRPATLLVQQHSTRTHTRTFCTTPPPTHSHKWLAMCAYRFSRRAGPESSLSRYRPFRNTGGGYEIYAEGCCFNRSGEEARLKKTLNNTQAHGHEHAAHTVFWVGCEMGEQFTFAVERTAAEQLS